MPAIPDRFPIPHSRFPALGRLESLSLRGMKLGLAAIDALCERLGRPERRVPCVLVAGTNGKGSTAATLAAISAAAGQAVGLYTSPHLIEVTERIRIRENDVSPERLDDSLARVFAAADETPGVPATYFEALTAAAFLLFAREGLDLAVLEVGLGGRFDATNVAPARVSVVTSIGLDHTQELGNTLLGIAREKAGIFRRGMPALARAQAPEALETLRACAEETGARWHDASSEMSVIVTDVSLEGTRFELRTPQRRILLSTPLAGAHQAWNAALAVRSAELLSRAAEGVPSEAFERGVASTRWPGRLESFRIGERTVVLDGCHNPEAAAALAGFLDRTELAGKCRLIFAAMADKDVESIAGELFPRATRVWLVGMTSSRAAAPGELARRVGALASHFCERPDVGAALAEALADDDPTPIIVAGSLYLVGEARSILSSRIPEGHVV